MSLNKYTSSRKVMVISKKRLEMMNSNAILLEFQNCKSFEIKFHDRQN